MKSPEPITLEFSWASFLLFVWATVLVALAVGLSLVMLEGKL